MSRVRHWRWPKAVVGLVVVGVVVGGGYAAYAAKAGGPAGYRTATVEKADVEQTLTLSGTVSQLGESDLAFGASGTVARAVRTGAHVRKGQVLARLDATALRKTLISAQAAVAGDRATLAKDAASLANGSSSSSSTAQTPTAAATTPAQSTGTQGKPGQTGGPSAAQMPTCDGMPSASACLQAVQAACATSPSSPAEPSGSPSTSAEPTPSASSSPTPSASASEDTATGATTDAAVSAYVTGSGPSRPAAPSAPAKTCAQALQTLQAYVDQLTSALQQAQQGSAATPSQIGTTSTKTSQAGTTSTPTSQPGGGTIVTAATVARDRATLASDQADLAAARLDLRGAVLRAPAAGRVVEADVAKGDTSSAGATAVIVVAKGLATVSLSVSSAQVAQLHTGQAARVTPAGAGHALAGSVTSVSKVPASSSTSTTYPVVVTLARRDPALLVGTTASVEIVTGSAHDALTVPTSAVSDGTVRVLEGGTVQRVRVTTGLVGHTRTVVTAGLAAGQEVVLADLSQALPSGDSTQQGGFGGTRFGGFGGGAPARLSGFAGGPGRG